MLRSLAATRYWRIASARSVPADAIPRLAWLRPILVVDVAMLAVATVLAEYGAANAGIPSIPLSALIGYPLLVLSLLACRGMYRSRLYPGVLDDLRAVATITALSAMVVLSVRSFFTTDAGVAPQSARHWAFAAGYLAVGRAASYWVEKRARRDGHGLRPTLIIGAGNIGRLLAQRLLERPELGLRPIGFLDKEPRASPELGLPILGASWDFERVVAEHNVKHVVVSFSTAPTHVLLGILERAERLGLDASFVPRLYERTTSQMSIQHIGGLPLISSRRVDPNGWHFAVKYAFDRLVAAMLVVLAAPLLALVALGVWLDLGRPILFRQERVGRDGKPFGILKFRSMHHGDASSATPGVPLTSGLAPGGVEGEDRRSRMGAFIRTTSLDELPQLFNVLTGDMSLVGPRPERPEFASRFSEDVLRYAQRHRVKSGITGWAQVHGLRGKTSIADRAEWDNYYIENFSLWLDFKILLLTLAAVARPSTKVE